MNTDTSKNESNVNRGKGSAEPSTKREAGEIQPQQKKMSDSPKSSDQPTDKSAERRASEGQPDSRQPAGQQAGQQAGQPGVRPGKSDDSTEPLPRHKESDRGGAQS